MIRSKQRALKIGGGLICLLAPLITFFVILGSDFVMFDDPRVFIQNDKVGGLSLDRLPVILGDLQSTSHFTPVTGLFRSLTYELFAAEQVADPFGYHLGNWLLHAISTVFLYLVCYELIDILRKQQGRKSDRSWRWRQVVVSVLAALLWSLHPLRAEPVAWASSGNHCLATTFLFLSLWFYLKYVKSRKGVNSSKGVSMLWYAVGAYTLSLLSHPIAFVFFLVLVVIDIFPLQRLGKPTRWLQSRADLGVLLEKVPFVMAGLLVGLTTVSLQFLDENYSDPPSPPWELFGLLPRTMQGLYVWTYYVWRVWVPIDLAPIYTRLIHIQDHPLRLDFLLSAAGFLGISTTAILLRKRNPGLLAAWCCHLIMLFPVLGLTQGNWVTNDRYSLAVSVIWSLLFVGLMTRFYRKEIYRVAVALSVLVVLGLAIASHRQAGKWHDTESLCKHVIHVLRGEEGRADTYFRLARFYLTMQELEKSEKQVREAVRIRPNYDEARMLLATILFRTERYEETLMEVEYALEHQLVVADAIFLRGMVYMKRKEWDRAEKEFQRVIKKYPHSCDLAKYDLAKKQIVALHKLRAERKEP